MKKLISYLIICALLILPVNSLLAADNSVSFFEALGNFSKLEDYKLVQSLYGSAELEEYEDHISAEYRISISSVVDGGNTQDSFSRVSAYIKFTNYNEVTDYTPFKTMTVQANGEVITQDQTDLYFKLNNFNIGLEEPLPFAVTDIEDVKAMVDLYRGTWFHSSLDELANENLDVNQYIEYEEQFKEDPKEAIMGLSELVLQDADMGFSEEEMEEIFEAIGLALETRLFTERDVVAGRNTGFKFFNLNKSSIINFFYKLADLIDEELTEEDVSELRAALSKVSISGIYRIEDVYDVIDNLLVRFRLKDVEPINNLELSYRYKLSDLNKENSIKAPTEYEEWYAFEEF